MIIPLSQIEPCAFGSWGMVKIYVAMLHEQKTPPPILVIRQKNKRYRVLDGAHRLHAAALARRTKIKAQLVAEDL